MISNGLNHFQPYKREFDSFETFIYVGKFSENNLLPGSDGNWNGNSFSDLPIRAKKDNCQRMGNFQCPPFLKELVKE